jgi:chromosome segregation ATPase
MSRLSDTRQRTREAAAHLVANGKRPHELTVDLIYAEIQQGSRTTINSELKAWKDERAKADALGADLPPPIADSMRSLWVAAVEHGEQVFAQRRGELEAELEAAAARESTATAARDAAEASARELAQQIDTLREQATGLQGRLSSETAARNEALGQVQTLQDQLTVVRTDAARQLETVRQEQDRQASEFQQAIAERDAAFRAELDTATQRLESAQAHMLQQIDDARQAQRRAENLAGKLQQHNDQLQSDLTELRMQWGLQARELNERSAALQTASTEKAVLAADREALATELATSRGRLDGIQGAVRAAEARALSAEAQLSAAVSERTQERSLRKKAGGKSAV